MRESIELAEMKRYRGVTAPMFPVVWLVISKYLADRNDPKDWLDIYALHQRGAFDISSVTRRLKQMGLKEDAANFVGFMSRLEKLKTGD